MADTSRNLDRKLVAASPEESSSLLPEYRARLDFGIDLIETDLPVQLGRLLYTPPEVPQSKAGYFHLP